MLKMKGNFNNKKESKPLSHKALRVSGGGGMNRKKTMI